MSGKDMSSSEGCAGQQSRAKFAIPRLPQTVPRDRLFCWLDEERARPLVWICGPPGSGKTTLIADYLERSDASILWYRVDQSDFDLPTFFRNLREAAAIVTPQGAARLPSLTAEYLLDVNTFTRNFLSQLFGLLRTPAALVIDNLHDLADQLLNTILLAAVAELPREVRLFAISRNTPSWEMSALQVKGDLAILDWDSLRLTLDEARSIAQRANIAAESIVRSQLGLSDGWVAGFVLLLERSRQSQLRLGPVQATQGRDELFSYFSSELFATVPASIQHLLLCTALLPSFSANQAAVFRSMTAQDGGIEWLQKRNLFIDSRVLGHRVVYRYHDLFREFLLVRGREMFAPQQRRELLCQAGRSAEGEGQPETALALLVEAGEWAEAVRLVCAIAPELIQQGCGTRVDRWMQDLPEEIVAGTPWLRYWAGLAHLTTDPGHGRLHLQAAFARFQAADDTLGCLLSCAAIVQSFFLERGDQHPLDPWLETFRNLLHRPGLDLPPALESQILSALIAVILRHPGDTLLELAMRRGLQLVWQISDPLQWVPLASFLIVYCEVSGRWAEGLGLLRRLDELESSDLSAALLLQRSALRITWRALCADFASEVSGRKEIAEFFDLSERSGIRVFDVYGVAVGVCFSLGWRDPGLGEQLLDRVGRVTISGRTLDDAQCNSLRAAVALAQDDLVAANAYLEASMEQSMQCGTRLGWCQNMLILAQISAMRGESAAALEQVESALAFARSVNMLTFEHAAILIKAYTLLNCGSEEIGRDSLRMGLALGRSTGQSCIAPLVHPRIPGCLYAVALRHGIEIVYVRSLIRAFRIPPPSPDVDPRWPWSIRIYTLGQFALFSNDKPVPVTRKAQKKPLNILRAVLALGGSAVPIETLMRQVWPKDGLSARPNFDVALARLRALLGSPDALIVTDGKLTLSEQVCWTDCRAFENVVAAVEKGGAPEHYESAFQLYRGAFLAGEQDIECVSSRRERLLAKFHRIVLQLGAAHERLARFDLAAQVYRRALEEDNLVEQFHQRLIYCEWRRGNRAEAIKSYHRCRDLLQIHLRSKPGLDTELLYRRMLDEAP
jgi:LuxR family transcriptional regulator, maltose regulon positive regulatory protein